MTALLCQNKTVLSLIGRLRWIFDAQPALRLTSAQIQHVLDTDPAETGAVLDRLVQERYLRRCADGCLTRAS